MNNKKRLIIIIIAAALLVAILANSSFTLFEDGSYYMTVMNNTSFSGCLIPSYGCN